MSFWMYRDKRRRISEERYIMVATRVFFLGEEEEGGRWGFLTSGGVTFVGLQWRVCIHCALFHRRKRGREGDGDLKHLVG